jgi:hypothetical protein
MTRARCPMSSMGSISGASATAPGGTAKC